jgi:hypothetical protein
MKCRKCEEEGKTSKVYSPMGGTVTCMAHQDYYDEAGAYHSHDLNYHGEKWSCSNGHHWSHRWQAACPAGNCEWNKTRVDETRWES